MVVEYIGGRGHQREKKREDVSRQKYWLQKMEVKRIIAIVREREMEHTLERLTEQKTEGLKQIFRMARQANEIQCIRGKDGQLKVLWKNRIKVWKEYEESLQYSIPKINGVVCLAIRDRLRDHMRK